MKTNTIKYQVVAIVMLLSVSITIIPESEINPKMAISPICIVIRMPEINEFEPHHNDGFIKIDKVETGTYYGEAIGDEFV